MKLQFKLEKVNSYVLQVPKYCVFLASLYSIYCILVQRSPRPSVAEPACFQLAPALGFVSGAGSRCKNAFRVFFMFYPFWTWNRS